jgi:hypothetical protein
MSQTAKVELEIEVDDDAAFDEESLKQIITDELNAEFEATDDNGDEQWITMKVKSLEIDETEQA